MAYGQVSIGALCPDWYRGVITGPVYESSSAGGFWAAATGVDGRGNTISRLEGLQRTFSGFVDKTGGLLCVTACCLSVSTVAGRSSDLGSLRLRKLIGRSAHGAFEAVALSLVGNAAESSVAGAGGGGSVGTVWPGAGRLGTASNRGADSGRWR